MPADALDLGDTLTTIEEHLPALAAFNVVAWVAAIAVLPGPVPRAAALIAWGLGLRHGLDPDHIVAIDNAVRRMITHGRDGIAAGLWFVGGHSTVVLGVSARCWRSPPRRYRAQSAW